MKTFIYILLFISIICSDPRKPSKFTRNCLIEELGEEKVKNLFASFRKYHRSNGKAKFSEFIYDKKPELKETLEKCRNIKKKRRLDKEIKDMNKEEKEKMVKEMIKDIKEGKKIEALNKCKIFMNKEGLCERLINRYPKNSKR